MQVLRLTGRVACGQKRTLMVRSVDEVLENFFDFAKFDFQLESAVLDSKENDFKR